MTPVQPTLIEQFKNLRQKAVPIIAIEAADQMVAAQAIMAKYPDGKVPKIGWDSAKGFKGFNQAGGTADTLDPEDACDPAKAFKQLGTFPPGSMVFIFNAHLYLREMYPGRETVIQAIANVRDAYKTSAPARTLVLMAPSIVLPPELANDVLVLEEPAIRKEEVRRIVRDQHANAKKRAAEQGVTFGDLDDTTLELATSATLGCGSAFLVEQIVSVALDPESKTGLNLPNLWLRKNKVINDTRGLATAGDGTTFKDITGMAALKEYFAMTFAGKEPPEAMAFIDEGEKAFHGFGTETSGSTTKQLGQFLKFMQDHRVLGFTLIGFAGCLSEGTRIAYRRGVRTGACGRSLPIETLFEKFNGIGAHAGAQWHPNLPTFTQSWDAASGRIVYNEITAVVDSGIKECRRIITDTAGIVELTDDHPVLVKDGTWRNAGEIEVGDVLLVRGSMLATKHTPKRTYRDRVVIEGLKYHPLAWKKIVTAGDKRYEYGRTTRARLVVEATMNRMPLDEFIRVLKNEPETAETLVFLPTEYDVHHLDENPMNDVFDNLVVETHERHAQRHMEVLGLDNFNFDYTATAHVIAVTPIGPRRTFDMSMADPLRNFVVNDGVIVHNCGKTQIIKACEGEFGRPVIAVKPEELEDSLVGGTALWTGLAQRTLDSISNGRLIMGITVNSMGTLPPEFKRRFSDTFFIDLPGPDALAECWKLYMRKWELTGPIPPHEGWTPDQVMKCCHRAFRFSCSLEQSAKFVVPFAVSNRKLIEELRSQADGIYLSADQPGAYHKPDEAVQRSVSFKPEEER